MIGIFDSGRGGLMTLSELRRIAPHKDVIFFADKKNAPYGTKTENELIRLVKRDVEILKSNGAEEILMGCCTACTVYDLLPIEIRKTAHPIIKPTANEAYRVTKNGKIGIIATERTIESGAFSRELSALGLTEPPISVKAQRLVSLIEGGACDGNLKKSEKEELDALLAPVKESGADTLILGCTHFPYLEKEISKLLPGVRTVSSALMGAKEILRYENKSEMGKTIFIDD